MDMHESENRLAIGEEDIPTYMQVYKGLKDTFRGRTRFFLFHIEDDIWEMCVTNLTSREWLEFCATVYSELPEEQEVAEIPEEVKQSLQDIHDNFVPPYEPVPEDEDPEEESVDEEEEAETPAPDAIGPRTVKKPILVKKATNVGNNVTVEED